MENNKDNAKMAKKFGTVMREIRLSRKEKLTDVCKRGKDVGLPKLAPTTLCIIEMNKALPSELYMRKLIEIYPNNSNKLLNAYRVSQKAGMQGYEKNYVHKRPYISMNEKVNRIIEDIKNEIDALKKNPPDDLLSTVNTLIGRMEHIQAIVDEIKDTSNNKDLIARIENIEEEIKERITHKEFRYSLDKTFDAIVSNKVECNIRRDEFMDFKKSVWGYILFCVIFFWILVNVIGYIFSLLI